MTLSGAIKILFLVGWKRTAYVVTEKCGMENAEIFLTAYIPVPLHHKNVSSAGNRWTPVPNRGRSQNAVLLLHTHLSPFTDGVRS